MGHNSSTGKDDDEIAQCILNYLRDHRQSSDTPEGIAMWWMMRQRLTESTAVILRVLRRLQAEGHVVGHRAPDGRILYATRGSSESAT